MARRLSSYTTPAGRQLQTAVATFTVAVTNSAGSATSNAATLTVNSPGQLTSNANEQHLELQNAATSGTDMLTGDYHQYRRVNRDDLERWGIALGPGITTAGVSTGQMLTSGQQVTLNVTFAPSSAGNLAGSVTITSNATPTTLTISLLGVAVAPVSHSATLGWTASASSVSGYNVYRGSVSGGPYTLLNSSLVTPLTYTDSTVQGGQTYYYVVTAVDSSGNESSYSSQISGIVPAP